MLQTVLFWTEAERNRGTLEYMQVRPSYKGEHHGDFQVKHTNQRFIHSRLMIYYCLEAVPNNTNIYIDVTFAIHVGDSFKIVEEEWNQLSVSAQLRGDFLIT